MTPNLILAVILTMTIFRIFTTAADASEKAAALTKAGYTRSASAGCLDLLTVAAMLALWWWYAIDTDQILIGCIPTVALVAALIASATEAAAKSARNKS